jgi:hypothetical protein
MQAYIIIGIARSHRIIQNLIVLYKHQTFFLIKQFVTIKNDNA